MVALIPYLDCCIYCMTRFVGIAERRTDEFRRVQGRRHLHRFLDPQQLPRGHWLHGRSGALQCPDLSNENSRRLSTPSTRCFWEVRDRERPRLPSCMSAILVDLGILTKGRDFVGAALGRSEERRKGILATTAGKVLVVDEAFELYGGSAQGPLQYRRQRHHRGRESIPLNTLFGGPPETGKTTTAKKAGKVFYDMAFVLTADVIKYSATDLVGQYVGQTGAKVLQLLNKALGWVLLIDEVYGLGEGHFANSRRKSKTNRQAPTPLQQLTLTTSMRRLYYTRSRTRAGGRVPVAEKEAEEARDVDRNAIVNQLLQGEDRQKKDLSVEAKLERWKDADWIFS
ncbi:hypothetical protein OOU_Y34scaffold00075g5 [Pyricularia oryzae Y34]|uniref:ATPase AAA-type core domain-containing protein n=1 Tax=Pyricularia oryzae (strain Y34) TaxID=1143189 RepID=A0AA97P9S0_PYRO3|nr:hypothetical protein OOU_Y34scaffold00075g5 [Pyricularia oryzae Y34]